MLSKAILSEKKTQLAALAAALICGIITLAVMNLPESVGLGNNGDYPRAIFPSGITFREDIEYNYQKFTPDFKMVLTGDNFVKNVWFILQSDYSRFDYVSAQEPLLKTSMILNLAANKLTGSPRENYSILWLGLIYTVIFCVSAYFILGFIYRRFGFNWFLFASILCLFVFCDQGYTLYYNSFYGEPLQYTGTLLTAGLFLRLYEKRASAGAFSYLAYYGAVLLMSMSKNAYVPIGILFALLPLVFIADIKFRASAAAAMCAFSILIMSLCLAYMIPSWIEEDTNFHGVFAGILMFSETPEKELEALGIDPSYAVLKGWEKYLDGYPVDIESEQFRRDFYDKIGKMRILGYYLTHPAKLIDMLDYTAEYSKYIRPYYIGSVQNPAVMDPSIQSEQSQRFSLYETLRVNTPVNNLWVTITVFAASAAVIVLELYKNRKKNAHLACLHTALLGSAVFNFVTPYMGNGVPGIAKHMFGFIYFYDILIFILISYVVIKIKPYVARLVNKARSGKTRNESQA